jgi:hypothetical protein
MGYDICLLYSQEPATGSYPESGESSANAPTMFNSLDSTLHCFLLWNLWTSGICERSQVPLYTSCSVLGSCIEWKRQPHVIQDVRMKVIQNKIIISQKAFIAHICGLYHYKRKPSDFFFQCITFSVNLSVGSLGGTTNIQTTFDLVPRCLKHVWC